MKKNITRCVIGLLLVCVLFLSCNFATGELVVYNQTSRSIRDVTYCGREFVCYDGFGGTHEIDQGKKASAQLSDEETGYVFFKIRYVSVRTSEVITVKKGEKTILSITDNTLVVVSGESKPVTILNVINNY